MDADTKRMLANGRFAQAAKLADAAAVLMAEHYDKRIANVRKAIAREEKYLMKVLRARNTGGVMAGDIEGAFHRLQGALDKNPFTTKRREKNNAT